MNYYLERRIFLVVLNSSMIGRYIGENIEIKYYEL